MRTESDTHDIQSCSFELDKNIIVVIMNIEYRGISWGVLDVCFT